MKTIINICVLSLVSILTSCGAQKTTSKLEVTAGALTASNSSYEGGLVFMGKSGDQNFTIPVSQSGSSNNVTIELKKGTWTFSAIAWDGTANEFEGTSLCDVQQVEIDDDAETVNLQLTSSKCGSTHWGDSNYRPSDFKGLNVVTCGWLYADAAGTTPVDQSTSPTFCGSGGTLEPERRIHATSVKLEIPKIVNGVISTGMTECLTSGSQGLFSTSKKIPTRGLPLKIKLYEVAGCNESTPRNIRGDYDFPLGLAGAQTDQQSTLSYNLATNIFLPTNSIKRGFSDFLAILPQIKCSGAHCGSMPTAIEAGGSDRIIDQNREFVMIDNPTANQTCDNIISLTAGFTLDTPFVSSTDCRMEDGKLIGKLDFTPFFGTGSFTITFNDATTQTVNVLNNETYRAFTILFTGLGHPHVPGGMLNQIETSFPVFFEGHGKLEHGLLSYARDMFEVDGPAGALGTVSCSAGFEKEKILSMYEDGAWETLRVIFKDSALQVSSREADGTMVVGTPYEKRMIIQKQDTNSVFQTMGTIDFICSSTYKIGVFEHHEKSVDGGDKVLKLYWNTQSATTGKVIAYLTETKKSGATIEEYRGTKIMVQNTSAVNQAIVKHQTLHLMHQGGNMYKYIPVKSQVYIQDSFMAFIEAADGSISPLSGVTDASSFGTISAATPGITKCIDRTGSFFQAVSMTSCGGYDVTFDAFTWSDLLPANLESAGGLTPVADFPAAD